MPRIPREIKPEGWYLIYYADGRYQEEKLDVPIEEDYREQAIACARERLATMADYKHPRLGWRKHGVGLVDHGSLALTI